MVICFNHLISNIVNVFQPESALPWANKVTFTNVKSRTSKTNSLIKGFFGHFKRGHLKLGLM